MEVGILKGASALSEAQRLPNKTVIKVSTNCS